MELPKQEPNLKLPAPQPRVLIRPETPNWKPEIATGALDAPTDLICFYFDGSAGTLLWSGQ
jgi:hypothetical protein